jgi:glycosyltransferase involved in cell wall biosynthesis
MVMMTNRISVVHLVETLGVGGMENGIANLSNRIDRSAFDWQVWCFGDRGEMASRIRAGADVVALNYGSGWNLGAVRELARRLRDRKVDILHCHGWGSRSLLGLLAARIARTPRCVNGEHGGSHNLRTRRQRLLQRLIAHRFSVTVSVSAALKRDLNRRLGLKPEAVTVIPNGVDTDRFRPLDDRSSPRRSLGLGSDEWSVCVVGTLKSEKNQQIVLRALAALPTEPPSRLVLVGDGPDRAMLAGLANSLGIDGKVSFLGCRDNVSEILPAMDALVLPSLPYHEGLSNVLLEAMACGVPTITSDSVGARELVEPEHTGVLFDYRDPAGLAAQIVRLRDDDALRHRVVSAALTRVRSLYSLDAMVLGYERFYRDLCEWRKGDVS